MKLMNFLVSLSLIVIGMTGCAYSPRVTYEPTLIQNRAPSAGSTEVAVAHQELNSAAPTTQQPTAMTSRNWSVVTDPVVLDINEEIPSDNSTASITNYYPETYVNYYLDAPYQYTDPDEFAAIALSSSEYNNRYYDPLAYYPRSTASISYGPRTTWWYYDDWDNRYDWYQPPYYSTFSYYSPYPYYAYSRGYNPWRSYGYSMVVYDGSLYDYGYYSGYGALYSRYSPLDYYNPFWSYDYYNDWGYSSPYLSHSGYPYYAYYDPYWHRYGHRYWLEYNKPKEEDQGEKREKRPLDSERRKEIRISSQDGNGSIISNQPSTVLSGGSVSARAKSNSRNKTSNSTKRQEQRSIERNNQLGYSFWAPVKTQQSRDSVPNPNYSRIDRAGRTIRTSREQNKEETNNGASTLVKENRRSNLGAWTSPSPTSRVSTWRRPSTSVTDNSTNSSRTRNPIVISPDSRQRNEQIKIIAPSTYNRYEPSRSSSSTQIQGGAMSTQINRSALPSTSYSNNSLNPITTSQTRQSYSISPSQSTNSSAARSRSSINNRSSRSSAPSSSNRSAYTYTSESSRRSPSTSYTPPRSTSSRSTSASRAPSYSPSTSSSGSRSYSSPAPRSAPSSSPSVNRSSSRSVAPSRSSSSSRSPSRSR